MRVLTIVAALLGLAGGTAIVGYYGFAAVGGTLTAIGWGGFIAICGYHLTLLMVLGSAWHAILPPGVKHPWTPTLWGRLVRDSGSEVLPLSQLGGFVKGARAATLAGLDGTTAFASTIVDVTLELLAQLAYTALGLALLARYRPDAPLLLPVALGLAAGAAGLVAFIAVQRRGSALLEILAQRLAREWLPAALARMQPIQETIHTIYRHRNGLRHGTALHLLGWIANAGEAWLALRLIGSPLDIGAVMTIESLLYAVRSFAFMVPNAVGVQEGAYVVLGALFGLPPQTALALSLLKRARDLAIGVPALLVWQALESRRALRAKA
jgi:putative membrane protein